MDMDGLEDKFKKEKLLVTSIGDSSRNGDIFNKLNLRNIKVDVSKDRKYDQAGKDFKNSTDFFKILTKVSRDKGKNKYNVGVYFKESNILLAKRETLIFEEALKLHKGVTAYLKERAY